MTIRSDPEKNEIQALLDMANLGGKKILEVGCGDGRLTWLYADVAEYVTAIDPYEKSILRAMENRPDNLIDQVDFKVAEIKDFAKTSDSEIFDLVILSWAL